MDRKGWITSFAVGTVLAAATGGAAAYLQEDKPSSLIFLVFALCTLPIWIGLASNFLVHDPKPPEHVEDSAEVQWLNRAASGAFLDLVAALGLSTAVTSIAGVDSVHTVFFCVLGLADWSGRYLLLQRREG